MAANDLERLAPLLATYLVHSTLWLGGCGALLWLTSPRNPAVRHAAWKWSVVAGFVTAFAQFTLPMSSRSVDLTLPTFDDRARTFSDESEPVATVSVPPARSVTVDESHVGRPLSADMARATEGNASGVAELAQARRPLPGQSPQYRPLGEASRGAVFGWLRAAVVIWAVAVGVLLTRTLVAWHRLSRLGDLTELSAGKERELLDRLLAATKTRRRVRLFRSQLETNPMAWGFWRWRIAVSQALLERLDRRELRALLAHELAHLARGDTRWLCAWSLLGTIGFLQPLNRIAQRQIRRAAELLSDSWAAEATGDRLSLARALTKAAELRGHPAVPLASLAVASSSALAERVDRLVGPDRSSGDSPAGSRLTVIVGALAIAAAVVWLPGVKLITAGDSANELSRRSDTPASPDDPIRTLDHELEALDRELDELRPFVPSAARKKDAVEVWQAIERRRSRLREGHVRVRQMLGQVTDAERSLQVEE